MVNYSNLSINQDVSVIADINFECVSRMEISQFRIMFLWIL